jgi:hypothetical protein
MQTECSAKSSAFGLVEGRPVVAEFDGGRTHVGRGRPFVGIGCTLLGITRITMTLYSYRGDTLFNP